jgi:hypothetical protein
MISQIDDPNMPESSTPSQRLVCEGQQYKGTFSSFVILVCYLTYADVSEIRGVPGHGHRIRGTSGPQRLKACRACEVLGWSVKWPYRTGLIGVLSRRLGPSFNLQPETRLQDFVKR